MFPVTPPSTIELLVDDPERERAGDAGRGQHDVVNTLELARVDGPLRFLDQVEHTRPGVVEVGRIDH
jgi:hypothetical protein